MMKFSINSKKFGEITFWAQLGGYIFVDLNGKPGCLGEQICKNGELMGSTLSHWGDEANFEKICRNWWRSYLRNIRRYEV